MSSFDRKTQRQHFFYFYDLPKNIRDDHMSCGVTATKLANLIYDTTGVLIDKMPMINYNRDMFKPFYSAYVSFEGAQYEHNKAIPADQRCRNFEDLKKSLKYFVINGKECRALPFDDQFLGEKREETNQKRNLFIRGLDKGLSHTGLEQAILDQVPNAEVKSLKISRDEKYKSKGYGFCCFATEEQAREAITKLENALPWNPTSIKDAEQKVKNNIYVKNIPDNWSEKELREVFELKDEKGQKRNISSLALMTHTNGKFAFICYQDPDKKDHTYGPMAAKEAVEKLNGKKFADKELYVTYAQNSAQRKIEVQRQIINLKQSKKRCNLLVRGFPESWKEEQIRNIFEQYGKIENIKILQAKNTNVPHSAFVCYEQPSEASEAKIKLQGKTFDSKPLEIRQYEIKELKDIQNLMARDRSDFQTFVEQKKGVNVSY